MLFYFSQLWKIAFFIEFKVIVETLHSTKRKHFAKCGNIVRLERSLPPNFLIFFFLQSSTTTSLNFSLVLSPSNFKILEMSRSAQANCQHHDAVAGTSREFVVEDYAQQLYNSSLECDEMVGQFLNMLTGNDNVQFSANYDMLLNLQTNQTLAVVFTNPLGWDRDEIAALPVNRQDIFVLDGNGNQVMSQISPNVNGTSDEQLGEHLYNLFWRVRIPAFGYSSYIFGCGCEKECRKKTYVTKLSKLPRSISNNYISLQFNLSSQAVELISNLPSMLTGTFEHDVTK